MAIPYLSFINSKELGSMMDVGGPTIHYIDDGSGPTMLFLHGLGFSLFTFRNNYPLFVKSMRIIAVDLPGCGYSRLPGHCGASPQDMAKYLIRLLDELKVERATICGAGEGGIVALEMAIRYPERVSALILSSPGSLTRHFPKPIRQLMNPLLGEIRMTFLRIGDVYNFLKWCCFNEIAVDNYMTRQVYRPFENRLARQTLLRLIQGYDDDYVHENLKAVLCPALIVWGEIDAGRPCGMADLYASQIPSSSVFLIRNCGMLPHEEKGPEFNERVVQFLLAVLPDLEPTAINGLHEEIMDYAVYEEDEDY